MKIILITIGVIIFFFSTSHLSMVYIPHFIRAGVAFLGAYLIVTNIQKSDNR